MLYGGAIPHLILNALRWGRRRQTVRMTYYTHYSARLLSHQKISILVLTRWRYYLRLAWCILITKLHPPPDPTLFHSRVYSYELDWNFHLNNTKYLDQACLARTQLFLSSPEESLYNYRDFKSYTITYKNELRVGEKYRIKTEVSESVKNEFHDPSYLACNYL
eukprot:sb/3472716/